MTISTMNYESILNTVRNWPVPNQISLVQDILRDMAAQLEPDSAPQNTLTEALGLLATDGPPPTDAEVKKWLIEERMKKYDLQ